MKGKDKKAKWGGRNAQLLKPPLNKIVPVLFVPWTYHVARLTKINTRTMDVSYRSTKMCLCKYDFCCFRCVTQRKLSR